MKAVFIIFALVGFIAESTVEAFGAASTSCRINRGNGELNMKIFDWKQRELFENYKVPDGKNNRVRNRERMIYYCTVQLFIYNFCGKKNTIQIFYIF